MCDMDDVLVLLSVCCGVCMLLWLAAHGIKLAKTFSRATPEPDSMAVGWEGLHDLCLRHTPQHCSVPCSVVWRND
jgi:hypothetical protein